MRNPVYKVEVEEYIISRDGLGSIPDTSMDFSEVYYHLLSTQSPLAE